jgi:hypothetical protein
MDKMVKNYGIAVWVIAFLILMLLNYAPIDRNKEVLGMNWDTQRKIALAGVLFGSFLWFYTTFKKGEK